MSYKTSVVSRDLSCKSLPSIVVNILIPWWSFERPGRFCTNLFIGWDVDGFGRVIRPATGRQDCCAICSPDMQSFRSTTRRLGFG